MIVADFDVFERTDCVVGEHRYGAVQRNQIGSDRLGVNSHEAYRQAGCLFTGKARLEESDYALLLFADTDQENIRLAAVRFGFDLPVDVELFRGENRHAAPGEERRT